MRLLAAEIADMFERVGPLVRGASEVVAWELGAIAAQGENFLKRGEVGEAIALLTTLGAGICAGYEKIWDQESEVGLVIDRCVLGSRLGSTGPRPVHVATYDPDELTRCVELFIEHGYPDEGHRVVETAATRIAPGRLQVLTWLYGQAMREADDKAAATWAEAIFREAPTVEHWGLLRASTRGTLRQRAPP